MRFMMIVKANQDREAGIMPKPEMMEAMTKYNEELVRAGVRLDVGGLQPSSKGARITWHGGKPQVTDGPFAETKELIAGFWIIQVKSREEAIEWAKRIPTYYDEADGHIELRPFYEAEDLKEIQERIRKENALKAQLEA